MNIFSQMVVLNSKFDVQQEMIEWFDKEVLVGEKVNIGLQSWKYKVYTCK